MMIIKKWFHFLEENWTGVILTQSFFLVLSALYGYWSQGLHDGKWDINTMWTGIGAIATAAGAAWGKWFVIGKYNTEQGKSGSMTGGEKEIGGN